MEPEKKWSTTTFRAEGLFKDMTEHLRGMLYGIAIGISGLSMKGSAVYRKTPDDPNHYLRWYCTREEYNRFVEIMEHDICFMGKCDFAWGEKQE